MSARLYVGNLDYSIDELKLETLFSEVGKVASVKIVRDRFDGGSKGFGFVEMTTDQDAEKAIQKFNETQIGERNIKVASAHVNDAQLGPKDYKKPKVG